MSSWRSSVAGRPSQRTGERHVAGIGIASSGAWRGSMGGWACARGLGPRTCPRFQPLARAPTPVSVRFSSWLARNPPKCARTYPQFVAFRAHFPLFSAVFDLPRRALPPVSCQRVGIRDGTGHKCASRWQEGGTSARAVRTSLGFLPAGWQKGGTCARAVRTSPGFSPAEWQETGIGARASRTCRQFRPSAWQGTGACARPPGSAGLIGGRCAAGLWKQGVRDAINRRELLYLRT
jgi:hypothetical protein